MFEYRMTLSVNENLIDKAKERMYCSETLGYGFLFYLSSHVVYLDGSVRKHQEEFFYWSLKTFLERDSIKKSIHRLFKETLKVPMDENGRIVSGSDKGIELILDHGIQPVPDVFTVHICNLDCFRKFLVLYLRDRLFPTKLFKANGPVLVTVNFQLIESNQEKKSASLTSSILDDIRWLRLHYQVSVPSRTAMLHGKNKSSCPICLVEFKDREKVCLLQCNHSFHHNCMVAQLKRKRLCPCCSSKVYEL